MMMLHRVWLAGMALLCGAIGANVAHADAVSDFYAGKRITLIVAAPAGSGYDYGARIFARHFGRNVPGNPGVIVQNMPGGGGRIGATYMMSAAPKDGTVVAAVQSFIAVDQLFDGDPAKPLFDPRQFNWLGSIANSTSVAVAWHQAKVKKWQDLQDNELVVGGVGAATPMVTFPYLFRRLLAMKFKVVSGYLGGPDVDLAMERGEVEGRVDYSWHTLKATRADWLTAGKLNPLFQMGLAKHPDLPQIPLLIDLVQEEEQRRILQTVFMSYEFGRAFLTTPGVPTERLAALRKAFEDTMRDKEFLAEAEGAKLEVSPVSSARLQALVEEAYNLPPSLIARAAALQKPEGGNEVQFRNVRATISALEKGARVAIQVIGGVAETINVDEGRTKITILRKDAKREELKSGMICAIAYLGEGTTAKSVECD